MKNNRFIFISAVSLFITGILLGQQQDIKFKHLTVDDGLAQNWVKCIYQDSYGYMWFGTGGSGINKYDGYEFKLYNNNPRNNNTLTNNWINTIYEDKQRRLWVGTQHGLNLYDRENDCFVRYKTNFNDYINGFYESREGKIYLITNYNIYEINVEEKTITPFCPVSNGCFSDQFNGQMVEDFKGNLWIPGVNGLYLVNLADRTFSIFRHNNNDTKSISDNALQCIYRDSKGRVWIGTVNAGFSLISYEKDDSAKPYFINFTHDPRNSNSISKGAVRTILDDGNGQLWIGIENGGVNILDLKRLEEGKPVFKHFKNNIYDENSLSENSIYSIFKDKQGIIWVGTYGGGINYYSKHFFKFELYRQLPDFKNKIINNTINELFEEGENLWIGTEGGLYLFDKKTGIYKSFYNNPNDPQSIGSNSVWSIIKDSRNNLWIGTWDGGLNLFDRQSQTFTRFSHDRNNPYSISSNNIFAMTEDENGLLWIATMGGGLNKYDYKTNKFIAYRADYNGKNSITGDWVQAVINSSNNELWLSTSDGVDIFNKKSENFINFKHDSADSKSISYSGANVLFEDSKKNIWLGTDAGLNFFVRKDSTFIYYREEDGLPNNSIKGICEDNKGNIWVSTNSGISKFINGVNNPFKADFKNYNKNDGLQGNEFSRRSSLKGSNGKIYFGGLNGFNAFYSDSIQDNQYIPDVVFTDFLISNKPVEINQGGFPLKKHISLTQEIVLDYNVTVISFKFAALNFILPEKNQYAYKMEGFEKEWNNVGNKREATYTNLSPGTYTFRVKASNNDGHWNETGTSIQIIILPPWWKSIWFRILIILFILSAFAGIYLIRVNVLKKQKLQLEKIVLERTHEVEEKNKILTNQTSELYEVNTLLEERNQYIEEQNQLLIEKTEKLNESHNILLQQKDQIEDQTEQLQTQTDYLMEINDLLQERQQKIEKQAAELTVSNNQLKTLNATKDKFFSIIAHDLKNPFNNIIGFSEILVNRYSSFNDEKKLSFINLILDSSRNIYKLLENLLQWARSQTGTLKFEPEEFVLRELIESNKDLVENMLQDKNIRFSSKIDNGVSVYADKNMINTVFRNLITNAIKFTENGEIHVTTEKEHSYIKVSIKDTGIGMTKERKEKIFDVGDSKSTKGTRGESGSGLGLILCKEFVVKNGGSVSVESEENVGTTFSFTIPVKKE